MYTHILITLHILKIVLDHCKWDFFCFSDELGLEEPRGTAAVFGEGDVFMHSQHDHGTGGHWCAKIIFFSLLAILVTLIGLIILENRGLSECKYRSEYFFFLNNK